MTGSRPFYPLTILLSNHFDAIHIRYANPEARNGGPTEPQAASVSRALLPALWHGANKLKHLVPVLAAGHFVLKKPDIFLSSKKTSKPQKQKAVPFSLGLPVPAKLPLSAASVSLSAHTLTYNGAE